MLRLFSEQCSLSYLVFGVYLWVFKCICAQNNVLHTLLLLQTEAWSWLIYNIKSVFSSSFHVCLYIPFMRHCHVYLNKKLNWNPKILIHVPKYIQVCKYKHSHFFPHITQLTCIKSLDIKFLKICENMLNSWAELWLLKVK